MKKYLILILLSFCTLCNAQMVTGLQDMGSKPAISPRDTIDYATLCVHYKMWKVKDVREEKKKYFAYDMFLQIGKNMSKFGDYNRYVNDSTVMMEIRKGMDNATITTGLLSRGRGVHTYSEEVFKRFLEKKYIVYDNINFVSDIYYEEIEPVFEWTLVPMEKVDTIMGYPCGKATTTFRGRTYEAWYTDVIAMDNGPWKFQGLPGLILYVRDIEKKYVIECTALYRPTWDSPITQKKKAQQTSRKKFMLAKKRASEDPIGSMIDTGIIKSIKAPDGSRITSSAMLDTPPYNPMELE